MDILSLDATDQLQELATLRISARELLEVSVARMDQLNPKLNAVVSRDLDRAYGVQIPHDIIAEICAVQSVNGHRSAILQTAPRERQSKHPCRWQTASVIRRKHADANPPLS